MEYTSRGLKRRRNTDKWEVTLSHRDPLTGEQVPSYHTVEAKTRKRAEKARDAEPSPLALAIELALTTGMRRGEVCGLRWPDIGEREVTVNRAISLDSGTPYEKNPKTAGSHRTIPLTGRLWAVLKAIEKDRKYVSAELGVPFGDPYVLGTADPNSRPYHPTQLTKDFKAFCEMNSFESTFHDLRHAFATMMIAGGTDVRTVASYLGHSNVAMTLNTYAEVDPDAKKAALGKVDEAFDIDLEGVFKEPDPPLSPSSSPSSSSRACWQRRGGGNGALHNYRPRTPAS